MKKNILLLLLIVVFAAGCTAQRSALEQAKKGASGIVYDYSPEAFEQALSSGKPTILEFAADWCVVCREEAPIIEKIKEEYKSRVNIMTANYDTEVKLREKYGIRGTPTFLVFDSNGKLVRVIFGAMTKKELENLIDELVKG